MALLLQLRARSTTTTTTTNKNTFTNHPSSLLHFFSSTSNSNDDEEPESTSSSDDPPPANPNSPYSSYFNDVKKVLKQGQPTPSSFSTPRNPSTLDEIRNNLTQFRRRVSDFDSTIPLPSPTSSGQISLQEIYKRNMAGKSGESAPIGDSRVGKIGGSLSFDAIRESVRSRRQNVESSGSERKVGGGLSSISAFSQGLRKEGSDSTALPASIFGKELREREKEGMSDEMKMAFLKTYRHEELGEKLRKLRPNVKGGDWFSLRELNDRLVKLREMDEKENEKSSSKIFGLKDLRDSLIKLNESDNQARKSTCK